MENRRKFSALGVRDERPQESCGQKRKVFAGGLGEGGARLRVEKRRKFSTFGVRGERPRESCGQKCKVFVGGLGVGSAQGGKKA